MQMTPFSDEFLGCRVNSLYTVATAGAATSPVYVNLTLQLEESAETLRPAVKKDIQRHLLGVIHRRSNNIGSSPLWVDSPAGSVSQLQGEHVASDFNHFNNHGLDEMRLFSLGKCTPILTGYLLVPDFFNVAKKSLIFMVELWNFNNLRSYWIGHGFLSIYGEKNMKAFIQDGFFGDVKSLKVIMLELCIASSCHKEDL